MSVPTLLLGALHHGPWSYQDAIRVGATAHCHSRLGVRPALCVCCYFFGKLVSHGGWPFYPEFLVSGLTVYYIHIHGPYHLLPVQQRLQCRLVVSRCAVGPRQHWGQAHQFSTTQAVPHPHYVPLHSFDSQQTPHICCVYGIACLGGTSYTAWQSHERCTLCLWVCDLSHCLCSHVGTRVQGFAAVTAQMRSGCCSTSTVMGYVAAPSSSACEGPA